MTAVTCHQLQDDIPGAPGHVGSVTAFYAETKILPLLVTKSCTRTWGGINRGIAACFGVKGPHCGSLGLVPPPCPARAGALQVLCGWFISGTAAPRAW